MVRRSSSLRLEAAFAAAWMTVTACGGGDPAPGRQPTAAGMFSNPEPGGVGGAGVGGFGNGQGGSSGVGVSGGMNGGAGTIGGTVCDADVYTGERKRLDIYMMVDDSGSMIPWWPATIEAISMFFHDPSSAGIGIGEQFFGSACEAGFYAMPRVPIAPLPDNLMALETAFRRSVRGHRDAARDGRRDHARACVDPDEPGREDGRVAGDRRSAR